jgi:hypothetical protein
VQQEELMTKLREEITNLQTDLSKSSDEVSKDNSHRMRVIGLLSCDVFPGPSALKDR